MVELVGMQSSDEAHFVRASLQIRKKIGNLNARLSAASEVELRILRSPEQGRAGTDEGELLALEHFLRTKLTVALLKLGLVIEKVEVRRGSDQVKIDYAFGLGREVGKRRRCSGTEILSEHLGQSECSDAHAYPLEELPPGKGPQVVVDRVHESTGMPSLW